MAISPQNPTLGKATWTQPVLKSSTGGWAVGACAAPPVYTPGSESETTLGAETLNNTQGASAPQGGFALVAGTAGSQTRQDH